MKVKCDKYEWEFDEKTAKLTCTRNGLEWRDETGDGAILALLQKCDDLQTIVQQPLCGSEPAGSTPKFPEYDYVREMFPNIDTEIFSTIYHAIKYSGNFA